jgi:hypothetical protein
MERLDEDRGEDVMATMDVLEQLAEEIPIVGTIPQMVVRIANG